MNEIPTLPTVDFCGTEITRVIVGGNPLRGYSHFSEELDREMVEYHTCENAVKLLFDCERNGINAMLSRGDEIIFNIVRTFREQGGTLHWIGQTASEYPDPRENIRQIASLKPIAIYHHGSNTDNCWKEGTIDTVQDYLKAIRDTGCAVGLGTHMPEVLRYAEDNNWDVDFYMACVYNLSKIQRNSLLAGGERVEEPFDDPDRDVMCEFIRSTSKPCLAFKILGSGRKCNSPGQVREAFQFAFDRIKPIDAVVVGLFQKHKDQVAEDCGIVREVLRAGEV